MSAPLSNAATVSLPASTLTKNADDLVEEIEKVSLNEDEVNDAATGSETTSKVDANQTPVANRVQTIPTVKHDLFSSPAEPKVGLTGSTSPNLPSAAEKESSLETTSAPAPAVEEEEVVPATPEPSHAKTMSFDWAADDDELDDELPNLDDWGVTLTPAKPSVATFEPAKDEKPKNGKGDGGEKPWRRGEGLKPKSKHAPSEDTKKGKGGRELFPPTTTSTTNGDSLGIRIAGRAKSASLSPEPESQPTKLPPPASTPYGRWNKSQPSTTDSEGFTIKGSGSRKAPPPKKDNEAKTRPRIAADLGALATLLRPAEEPSTGTRGKVGGEKGRVDRSRKTSPVVEKGQEWKKPSVGESMHAPPSVGESMHAPQNRTQGASGGGGSRNGGGGGGGKKKPSGGSKK